ncbi:uncharacterized protein LOC141590381 [Silene latifolia]|uniref:uncharacterized protein LOC141590381 n=1 Tax=Silene latifolia TaxID=37657 RepID=UPI003D773166
MLLLRALSTFVASSGLRVNATKSEVVFNGVAESIKLDIIQVSRFQEGSMPFKYLGIPIQAVRLTRSDCSILIDKIVSRVRGIGATKLSYAGRLVLINTAFNTLHNYWASIFLIPIEMICKNYLWNGDTQYHRVPLMAWQKVCCNKKEGGLGIKDARVWNIATVEKLVNWIYIKVDRLWVSLDAGYTPPVQWFKEVWDVWVLPKHSFIGWLIKHEALNTRVKLYSLGLCETNRCILCEREEEEHGHLFGNCAYSSRIFSLVDDWLQVNLSTAIGVSKLKKKAYRMIRMACWYAVWIERNQCRIDFKLRRPDHVADEVKLLVKTRLQRVAARPTLVGDRSWLERLGICI